MDVDRKVAVFVKMSLINIPFFTFFCYMFGYNIDISVPFCCVIQIILIK